MQTKIHNNTFKGCSKLVHVKLPSNISAIGDNAFEGCTSLRHIEMGEKVKDIGVSAFINDEQLRIVDRFKETNANNTFETVGDSAFQNTGLISANLSLRSSSIYTFWGDNCFQDCKNLTDVNILAGNYMSKEMFKNCSNLRYVNYSQPTMAYVYPGVFENCTSLVSIVLPRDTLYISENMFKGCGSLRDVKFMEITEYGKNYQCNLIQDCAFYGCTSLNHLSILSSIDSIDKLEYNCLSGCGDPRGMTQIAFDGLVVTQLSSMTDKNFVPIVRKSGFFGMCKYIDAITTSDKASLTYEYDSSQYVPYKKPIYPVDDITTTNFQPGKWYYNAREISAYAKANHMPCVFIYSMLGCGPCQIYQQNIWPNENFQQWISSQHFLACMLEVDKQPTYNKQLSFCVDELSPYAQNFTRQDQGENPKDTPANALGEKYFRTFADGAYTSNLMTPVYVFMDADGKCWDYSYHNLENYIFNWGVQGVINCFKELCLYHFDNNNISNPHWVVGCDKPFDKKNYDINAQKPNEFIVPGTTDIVDFGCDTPQQFNQIYGMYQKNRWHEYSDETAESRYVTVFGADYNNKPFPYLGGCWFSEAYFKNLYFGADAVSNARELMDKFINANNYKFKFGNNFYSLFLSHYYSTIDTTPCNDNWPLFIPCWTKIQ